MQPQCGEFDLACNLNALPIFHSPSCQQLYNHSSQYSTIRRLQNIVLSLPLFFHLEPIMHPWVWWLACHQFSSNQADICCHKTFLLVINSFLRIAHAKNKNPYLSLLESQN
ncbi:Uncharacterized protein TCM_009498 [Theobroma cacao]|uniref:Uncharacterized protein n=1 Tax=Theobroma cacao TaxID=3641 RepID=A0A061ECN7_THECC|nr:Uncharacterized protein TCM_009498 [Theobroma cacao]